MKRLVLRTGLLITMPFLLTTCSKIDWDFFQKHQDKKNCKVSAYYLTLNPEITFPFLFEKKFNHSGDRVTEIECSYNTVTLVEDLIHQQLRVVYAGKRIFFINKNNPKDTVLKAFLNDYGRVVESIGTGDLHLRNKYFYNANRLAAVEVMFQEFSVRDTCEYDSHGNILSISHFDGVPAMRVGYFFSYDYSKKAKRQFYLDEVRDLNNDFALLQYMGLFPELEPVNIRTHVRNGVEVGPATWDRYLANHRLDSKGKLLGYDIVYYGLDSVQFFSYKASVVWDCK